MRRSPTTSPRIYPRSGSSASVSQASGRRSSSNLRGGGLSKSVSFASPITQDLVAMAAMGGSRSLGRQTVGAGASSFRATGGVGTRHRPTSSSTPSSPTSGPSAPRPGLQDALRGLKAVGGAGGGSGGQQQGVDGPGKIAPLPSASLLMLSNRGGGPDPGGRSAPPPLSGSPPSAPLGQRYSGPRVSPPRRRNPDRTIAVSLPMPPVTIAPSLPAGASSPGPSLPTGASSPRILRVDRGLLLGSSSPRESSGSGTGAGGGRLYPSGSSGDVPEGTIDPEEEEALGLRALRDTVQRLRDMPR